MLDDEGLPPAQVLAEMAEFVAGCPVYADADLDEFWLEVLCQAVGAKLPFPVYYLGEFLKDGGYSRPQVVAALEEAKRLLPRNIWHARMPSGWRWWSSCWWTARWNRRPGLDPGPVAVFRLGPSPRRPVDGKAVHG
ncbi:hypothetical protein ACFSLT_06890 [Novosphingobium resinovorum]